MTSNWESIFSPNYYLEENPDVEAAAFDPLEHFKSHGMHEQRNPHPLFDIKFYLNQIPRNERPENPLEHYLNFGERQGLNPHPLVNIEWIKKQIKEDQISNSKLTTFQLYLTEKYSKEWNPNPLFYSKYYKKANNLPEEEHPLFHYLRNENWKKNSPHPAIDLDYIEASHPNLYSRDKEIIKLVSEIKENSEIKINPYFDSKYYTSHNIDLANSKEPWRHFLYFGYAEGRKPNAMDIDRYMWLKFPSELFVESPTHSVYLESKISKKPVIIFTSHDASKTGAPLIILRIVEHFSTNYDVDVVTLLDTGGELENEFKKVSQVYQLKHSLRTHDVNHPALVTEIKGILALFKTRCICVVSNSAESRHFSKVATDCGMKSILLWHEVAEFYPKKPILPTLLKTDSIIIPSHYILEQFKTSFPEVIHKVKVRGQGMIQTHFGKKVRDEERQFVREELSIPQDARIIIASGTLDLRKGIDHFCAIAREYFSLTKQSDNTYFIWIGGGHQGYGSPPMWAEFDAKQEGFSDRLLFVGPKDDIERYLLASDIFLMTSRADPFPCVSQEALACGIPVMTFDKCSGTPELIEHCQKIMGSTCGIVIERGENKQFATELLKLINDPSKLSQMGLTGNKYIKEHWCFESYVNFLKEEIETVSNSPIEKLTKVKDTRTTIFFSTPDWGISGVNTLNLRLIKQLLRMGFDARLLFTKGRFTHFDSPPEEIEEIPRTAIQPKSEDQPSIWEAAKRFLEDQDPCVYVPNYDYTVSKFVGLFPPQVRTIIVAHSDDYEHYEHTYRLGHFCDHIIAVSEVISENIVALNKSFASKISYIANGVDIPEEAAFNEKHKQLISQEAPIKLTYVGRLETFQKRILDYGILIKQLRKLGVNFHFTFCGDGREKNKLETTLSDEIANGIVTFTGRVMMDEAVKILEESHIFLLLSDFEGLSIALLESISRGCIPITTKKAAGPDGLIEHRKTGYIVEDPGDISTVSKTIKSLSENPILLHRMAADSYKKFKNSQYNIERTASAYSAIFQNSLKSNKENILASLLRPE